MNNPENIQELNSYTVLLKEDKILVLKRKSGFWEFPGGGVEWGENPEKTALRETKEETGITPSELKLMGITSATYKKEESNKHSVYIVYSGKADSEKVFITPEHSEYRWLTIDELKYLKLALNAEPVLDLLKEF